MHDRLLETVMKAPMSLFYETTAGSLANRFSQDMELIDMELPLSLINTVVMAFMMIARAIFIAVASTYIGAALPLCAVLIYFIQGFYLRTSRVLRLLEIEAKSVLFTHFLETLAGLVTIRSFGWSKEFITRNKEFLNLAQRPFYSLLGAQRWLSLVLDLLVSGIAITLATIAIQINTLDVGLTGLALVSIVGFSSGLKQLITHWTVLETTAGAITRVKSFVSSVGTEESDNGCLEVVDEWPASGVIEFENISASYRSDSPPILKGLAFKIEGGQKIGICGRSGSGKSSLLACVLRTLALDTGVIRIDGVDISTLSHQRVRSGIIALPQDAYLLPGTVRFNVDPLGENDDSTILAALEDVGLLKTFYNLDAEGATFLDKPMPSDLLSHGQRQLICLARAMMRRSSILVLDEATAGVDHKTEHLIGRIIKTHFKSHTVIAVAHRLDTILDFDRICLMESGSLLEYGEPRKLLSIDSGFKRLYDNTKSPGR
jgi:ATP-binding cassette, subfamily C (CFTR/MRP), member 1